MASEFIRKGLVYLLIPVFAASSFFLFTRNGVLERKNLQLSSETRRLQKSLDTAREETLLLDEKFKKIDNDRELLAKNSDTLGADRLKYEGQIKSLQEEKVYLEEMLIHKAKEIEQLRAPGGQTPVPGDLSSALNEKDQEIARLLGQNRQLSEKLDRIYKTMQDQLAQIGATRPSLEQPLAQMRRALDEQWNSVDLGAISLENANPVAPALTEKPVKKEGRVLAVNEDHGFVVVDLGKADNIKSDTVLSVKKDGKKVATLTVLEVRDVMAACNIKDLQPGKTIAINDAVSLS